MIKNVEPQPNPVWISLLLDWFDHFGRDLPWRHTKDPYRIWLSEIMLQQTQVQTVIPYYERFLSAYPSVSVLAKADETDVFKLWEGLGYYSRARNLLKAARLITQSYDGKLPDQEKQLIKLPGIGPYTAGAILSIAYQTPVPAADGNVVRVLSRLTTSCWDAKNPKDRKIVHHWLEARMPHARPGDFNEAIMDLGATICLPQDPACRHCPLQTCCKASLTSQTANYPVKIPAKPAPVEERVLIVFSSGALFHVIQRPETGLLAGLYTFDWLSSSDQTSILPALADGKLRESSAVISATPLPQLKHRFTHLVWSITAYWVQLAEPDLSPFHVYLESAENQPARSLWVSKHELARLPFPTAMCSFRNHVLGSSC